MNAKISVYVICAEAIIYLLLYNLHDCTFKYIFAPAVTLWYKCFLLLKKIQYFGEFLIKELHEVLQSAKFKART